MTVYAPDFYEKFHCIADKCKHTCCAGWEIDIDQDTYEHYLAQDGAVYEKIRANTFVDEEGAHFRLTGSERCPMLREDGLCELILAEGEGELCEICREHPRFYNFWSDRVEAGLGLVCEEAARIMLTSEHPLRLVGIREDEEEALPLDEVEAAVMQRRDELLRSVTETGPIARLEEALIYRHIAPAVFDGRLEKRAAFVERTSREIKEKWQDGNIDTLIETVRHFSDAVEYDSEALEKCIGEGVSVLSY